MTAEGIVGRVLGVSSQDLLIQSTKAILWSPLLRQSLSSVTENLYHFRNVVSSADSIFKCVLESSSASLGVRQRWPMTFAVVGAKVAK